MADKQFYSIILPKPVLNIGIQSQTVAKMFAKSFAGEKKLP